MDIVECHSEFAYAERPVALTWEGQRLEVDEILAAWRLPEGRRFRVRTLRHALSGSQCNARDPLLFELTYREADDAWQIQPLTGG